MLFRRFLLRFCVLLCGLSVLYGCSQDEALDVVEGMSPPAAGTAPAPAAPEADDEADTPPVYTGDLKALKERGRLRILIPANIGGVFYLPRAGWPVEAQHEAAADFARTQGLQAELSDNITLGKGGSCGQSDSWGYPIDMFQESLQFCPA